MPLVLGVAFASLDAALAKAGLVSWGFLRNLDGAGAGAFDLYTAMLIALVLRITAFVATLALVSPLAAAAAGGARRARPASTLQAACVLLLVGSVAAFLALPTFGLSIVAFVLVAYYTFFFIGDGSAATEAILGSLRITVKTLPATCGLALVPLAAGVATEAILRDLHLAVAGSLAGWMVTELLLAAGLYRASVAREVRLEQ